MVVNDLFGVTYSFEELHIYKWDNSLPCWSLFGSFPLTEDNNYYHIVSELGIGFTKVDHIEFHYNIISIYI